jgi:hypothetical protein
MTEKGDKPVLPLRPFLRLISFAGWAEKRSPTEKYIARKKRGCPDYCFWRMNSAGESAGQAAVPVGRSLILL